MGTKHASGNGARQLSSVVSPHEPLGKWQTIVIGAGPAGSSAAIACARRGLQVLLVDSKTFPRRKACGGCLNRVSVGLAHRLLGQQHVLWGESLELHAFRLRLAGRQFTFELPAGLAVDRTRFDYSLVQQAMYEGVTFAPSTSARLMELHSQGRCVELTDDQGKRCVLAATVVVASGLSGRAVADSETLRHQPQPTSRVGVETILQRYPSDYSAGMIHMAVGAAGYVGLTQLHDQRLHVAAAVDRPQLQRLGPAGCVHAILQQAGAPQLLTSADTEADWRGTPALTSRPRCIADRRVFLVGDAAGYVEPFTGEGIRWALETGLGVAPLVERAATLWHDDLITKWNAWYSRHIVPEQRLFRRLSVGLRSPTARWLALHALQFQPGIARRIIARLNYAA